MPVTTDPGELTVFSGLRASALKRAYGTHRYTGRPSINSEKKPKRNPKYNPNMNLVAENN